ncbi:MAG: hypothetical protein A2075_12020 [Geobacteraceae bacterium GWC2_58_44]|nr:MAG: hypothetical protein A2075_12020 [Geobacteraceae bacterium GWC2_58_44]HBG06289.1 hypothetical protein [Geobacter sp.]
MDRKTHRKVKALLNENGIKLKDVAVVAKVGVPAISGALNGHWESRPVQIALANVLGMNQKKFDRIWKHAV